MEDYFRRLFFVPTFVLSTIGNETLTVLFDMLKHLHVHYY